MPISEKIGFLYFEKAVVERDGHGLVAITGDNWTQIPIGRTSVLMLGPGVSVSHAAIALCSLEGALVFWVGENCVRLYGACNPKSNSAALLHQAELRLNMEKRLEVAKRIYLEMFGELAPERRSIEQLRGVEGGKVKAIYEELAVKYNINWSGRSKNMTDPLNAAISTATSALYGITEAAILALGYSPAIGFIHNGDPRSFVFDVADTVKFKTVVPLAFELVSISQAQVEKRIRVACRELFVKEMMLFKLVCIIQEILGANVGD